MQSKIKTALVTTGMVLLTIYVMRKLPVTNTVVNLALNG